MQCFQFAKTGKCSYGERCKFEHTSPLDGPSGSSAQGSTQSRRSKGKKRKRQKTSQEGSTPIVDFFDQYPGFTYDPSKSVTSEFHRMCDMFGWARYDDEKDLARESLRDAMTQQFNIIYGTDENSLSAWRNLCQVLHIDPIPDDLSACRNTVKATHVNLVDLIDAPNTFQPIQTFPTEQELSVYTVGSAKYFPKENAYAGGLLRFLLRNILSPSEGHMQRRPGIGSRRRNR